MAAAQVLWGSLTPSRWHRNHGHCHLGTIRLNINIGLRIPGTVTLLLVCLLSMFPITWHMGTFPVQALVSQALLPFGPALTPLIRLRSLHPPPGSLVICAVNEKDKQIHSSSAPKNKEAKRLDLFGERFIRPPDCNSSWQTTRPSWAGTI